MFWFRLIRQCRNNVLFDFGRLVVKADSFKEADNKTRAKEQEWPDDVFLTHVLYGPYSTEKEAQEIDPFLADTPIIFFTQKPD